MKVWRSIFIIGFLFALTSVAFAGPTTYKVTVNTSSLAGKTGALDFNFNPGPLVTQTAAIKVSGFASDGTLLTSPSLIGDVSGTLAASLAFDNGTALNDSLQGITYGSTLTFLINVSGAAVTNPDGVSSSGSTFAFSLFSDAAGTKPALTSDTTNGFGVLVNINLDGSTTIVSNLTTGTVGFVPTVTVTPSSSSITTAQSLSVAIAITGISGGPTPTGSVVLTVGAYTSGAASLVNGSATVTVPAGAVAVGSYTITAAYSGDATYSAASGTSALTVVAPTPPGLMITSMPVTITAGSTSGNTSTVTITPVGGFTGAVALSAVVTSFPPGAIEQPIVHFTSANPVTISGTAPVTATLAIATTANTAALINRPTPGGRPIYLAGLTGFLCLILLRLRQGKQIGMLRLATAALCIATLGVIAGCAGSGNPGTTKGAYTVTITATSGTVTAQGTVSLTVQ